MLIDSVICVAERICERMCNYVFARLEASPYVLIIKGCTLMM